MRVGVFLPDHTATSMRIYAENVMNCLSNEIVFSPFGKSGAVPKNVDLYWDPRSGSGNPPPQRLRFVPQPIVLTVHGATYNTEVARKHRWVGWRRYQLQLMLSYKWLRWLGFRQKIKKIITVSHYSAQLLPDAIGIPEQKISVIYHGVDHEIFFPQAPQKTIQPYLLYVAAGARFYKNIPRLLQAYSRLDVRPKPALRMIVADFKGQLPFQVEGVELIRERQSHAGLVQQYRNALGFVFPSLRETFGMPIIEAMASGCPVITSQDTSCVEIAGDAALLVDPYAVESITEAMKQLVTDEALRIDLRQRGLERSRQFTWELSAYEHQRVFQEVLDMEAIGKGKKI